MPGPHTTMRKIRDVQRLRFGEGLSLRQTASSLSMLHTAMADDVYRAKAAGLAWPLGELDDEALGCRLLRAVPLTPSRTSKPRSAS